MKSNLGVTEPTGAPNSMNQKFPDTLPPDPSYVPLKKLMGAVVALWALSGFALYFVPEHGTFGDMFGAINALFTGLAFAGVIYTILLQRRELELQRAELRATRVELARSAQAQERSEEALRKQVEAAEDSQRLATLNNLLQYALQCRVSLRNEVLGTQEQAECNLWASRRFEIAQQLDEIYQRVRARE